MSSTEHSTSIDLPIALSPVLSERFAARPSHVAMTALFAGLFVLLSYLPLSHSGMWRYVSEGHWILQNGKLPASDPVFMLAEGMPYQITNWLSLASLALIDTWAGAPGISVLYAIATFSLLLLMGLAAFESTHSKTISGLFALIVLALWWPVLGTLDSTLLAAPVFGIFVLMLQRQLRTPQSRKWPSLVGFAGLAVLWANLDSSFIIALLLLASCSLGRVFDTSWRMRRPVLGQLRSSRFWIWAFELAAVATLLQPNGINLWGAVFQQSTSSWWVNLGGIDPLTALSWNGIFLLILGLLAGIVLRTSRQRITGPEILLFVLGLIAVSVNQRLVIFFGPVLLLSLLKHLQPIIRPRLHREATHRVATSDRPTAATPSRFYLTVLCGLIAWVTFCLCPISQPVLGGQGRRPDQVFDGKTPMQLASFLTTLPHRGLVWSPAYWGDYLGWSQHGSKQFFAGSTANHLPEQVKYDYRRILLGEHGWQKILERYGVDIVVCDKARQPDLISGLLTSPDHWVLAYEDNLSIVFVYRTAQVAGARL